MNQLSTPYRRPRRHHVEAVVLHTRYPLHKPTGTREYCLYVFCVERCGLLPAVPRSPTVYRETDWSQGCWPTNKGLVLVRGPPTEALSSKKRAWKRPSGIQNADPPRGSLGIALLAHIPYIGRQQN